MGRTLSPRKKRVIFMRYDAVIFDLDGTLLNTLDDLAAAVNAALTACGYPTRTLDEVRAFVGNGVAKLIHRAVPAGTAPEEEARCLERFRAHYLVHMRDQTAPYSGILPLLDALQQAGIAVAVVSNKFDAAVKELCRDYFGPRVPVALGESPSVRKKPAPDTVFAALRALDVPADRAVYVGDSDVDIETARNAGTACISVSWGFRDSAFLYAHGTSCIADTPQALAALLLTPEA